MANIKLSFIFICLCFVAVGCSKGKTTKATFVISVEALSSGETFTGGVVLHVVDSVTGQRLVFDLTNVDSVSIPHGTWDFYLVGYDGQNWQGNTQCGGAMKKTLSSAEAVVDLDVGTAACVDEKYAVIMKEQAKQVVGTWDSTNFDQSAWGP